MIKVEAILHKIENVKYFIMRTNFTLMATVLLTLITTFAFGQNIITGTVVDSNGEPLPDADITVQGTGETVSTDLDGNYSIEAPDGEQVLLIEFLGLGSKEQKVKVKGDTTVGTVILTDGGAIDEVVFIGKGIIDVATGRATPVAVSTIRAEEIQEKGGNQEFPEILKNTPSVYVSGQAGGYGDSEIRVRGFDQTNTAYLLNGQPINGMEDGKMYWSNWSGMMDIATAVQTQRGLGASKLAISSVGGTTNIITKATDAEQNGSLKFTVANNGYWKSTAQYSTGLSNGDTGFGATVLMSYWRGDGYMEGTRGEGQNYFISLGYKPNEAHTFNFLLTGAPQKHDQAFNETIGDYMTYGLKYNNNYGFYNDGTYKTMRRNYYHKPVANLNWDWEISEKSNLSTVLYASWGRGGGTGPAGARYATTENGGYVDWSTTVANNAAITDGSNGSIIRASVNNHNWYGLVTNFNTELTDDLTFNIGFDGRTYKGSHYRKVIDFLGMSSYTDTRDVAYPDGSLVPATRVITKSQKADPWNALSDNPSHDQRLAWDYEETINYGGFFGQLEYDREFFSAFVQGSISQQWHTRTDFYNYTPGNQDAEDVNNSGYNIKGGFNIKPNKFHNFYVNSGYYSKQPFHDNIYLNFRNDVNPLTTNEKVFGLEAGYKYSSRPLDVSVNLYRTHWKDRVEGRSYTQVDEATGVEQQITVQNSGVNQLHQGVELDFFANLHRMVDLKGFFSWGDWEYDDDIYEREYDENLNLISEGVQNVDDSKVGGAAQTTAGLGLIFEPIKGLKFDADWRYYHRLYADVVVEQNVMLPSYNLFDVGAGYEKPLGGGFKSIGFRVNVNNLFDNEYIAEITRLGDNSNGYYGSSDITLNSQGMFGMGRTFNAALTLKF